jgi:hypothetical protein
MNTYAKFCPNVFVAKCPEMHAKGETILVETKHGRENECIVHNLVGRDRDGSYYYSITRADGFNSQERALRKAERFSNASANSERKSNAAYEASNEGRDFLSLGEPIKVGHHSEKRHRALIERNWNRMGKAVELGEKAKEQADRAAYYASIADKIDLSMPESLEFYEYKVEEMKERHAKIKSGEIPREHAFTLQYANRDLKEAEKNLALAKRLWA